MIRLITINVIVGDKGALLAVPTNGTTQPKPLSEVLGEHGVSVDDILSFSLSSAQLGGYPGYPNHSYFPPPGMAAPFPNMVSSLLVASVVVKDSAA